MGLMSKIEDKLSSKDHSQGSKHGTSSSSYGDQSSNSHLRHPVGTGAAGTSQGYDSSTTGTSGSHGMTSSGYNSGAATGYGSSGADVGRDGYGTTSPSGHGSSRTDPRDAVSSGGIGHSSRDYDSTGRTDPRETGFTSGHGSGAREPYDPYSSKGQSTAARAANAMPGHHGDSSHGQHGSSNTYANEPNAIPTAGGQRVGSSNVNDPYYTSRREDPYSSSTQHSSGHPIRDAALGGAAGSAMGEHGHHDSSRNQQDVSYMNRSGEHGGMSSGMGQTSGMGSNMPHHQSGSMGSGMAQEGGMMRQPGMGSTSQSGGMTSGSSGGGLSSMDPEKMGGAYAKGYADAMEHAKQQLGK